MSFPRYPKYKPSGVEWLGEVPEGWLTQRLKHSSRIPIRNGLGESAESDDPTQPRYVRITDIKSPRELHESTFKSLPKETADLARFHVGDILFACVGATFGKSYLHLFDAGPMCFAGYLARYSPKPLMDSRFISYWTESRTYWDQLQANVIQSTIQNFSAAKYRELVLVIPPVPEQTAIAEFLDRETGKIDGLVAQQRRLMELLKEKRQAVISYAVTKGLNPHAPMKPSGIEWLGDVPAHWKIGALAYFARIRSGSTPNRENPAFWGGNIPWVKTGEINYTTIIKTEETITSEALISCSLPLEQPGTLLMALYGQGATRGRVAALGIAATFNQACAAIVPDSRISSGYLQGLLLAAYEFVREIGNETTQMNLNLDFVRSFRVLVPPVREQEAIVELLESESAKFDALTAEAQRAILLLQERRASLISAAITGQIDVRQHALN